jgi:hypothetical protein
MTVLHLEMSETVHELWVDVLRTAAHFERRERVADLRKLANRLNRLRPGAVELQLAEARLLALALRVAAGGKATPGGLVAIGMRYVPAGACEAAAKDLERQVERVEQACMEFVMRDEDPTVDMFADLG